MVSVRGGDMVMLATLFSQFALGLHTSVEPTLVPKVDKHNHDRGHAFAFLEYETVQPASMEAPLVDADDLARRAAVQGGVTRQQLALQFTPTQPVDNDIVKVPAAKGQDAVGVFEDYADQQQRTGERAKGSLSKGARGLGSKGGENAGQVDSLRDVLICTAFACLQADGKVSCVKDCDSCMTDDPSDCRDTMLVAGIPELPAPAVVSSDTTFSASSLFPLSLGRSAKTGSLKVSSTPKDYEVELDNPLGFKGYSVYHETGDGDPGSKLKKRGGTIHASRYASKKNQSDSGIQWIPQWGVNGDPSGDEAYESYGMGPVGTVQDDTPKPQSSFSGDKSFGSSDSSDEYSSGSSHLEYKSSRRESELSALSNSREVKGWSDILYSFPLSFQSMSTAMLYEMIFITALLPVFAAGLYTRTGQNFAQNPSVYSFTNTTAFISSVRVGIVPEAGDGNLLNLCKAALRAFVLHLLLKYLIAGNSSTGAAVNVRGREPIIRNGEDPGLGSNNDVYLDKHRGVLRALPDLGPYGQLMASSFFYDRTSEQDSKQTSSLSVSSSARPGHDEEDRYNSPAGAQEQGGGYAHKLISGLSPLVLNAHVVSNAQALEEQQ